MISVNAETQYAFGNISSIVPDDTVITMSVKNGFMYVTGGKDFVVTYRTQVQSKDEFEIGVSVNALRVISSVDNAFIEVKDNKIYVKGNNRRKSNFAIINSVLSHLTFPDTEHLTVNADDLSHALSSVKSLSENYAYEGVGLVAYGNTTHLVSLDKVVVVISQLNELLPYNTSVRFFHPQRYVSVFGNSEDVGIHIGEHLTLFDRRYAVRIPLMSGKFIDYSSLLNFKYHAVYELNMRDINEFIKVNDDNRLSFEFSDDSLSISSVTTVSDLRYAVEMRLVEGHFSDSFDVLTPYLKNAIKPISNDTVKVSVGQNVMRFDDSNGKTFTIVVRAA